MAFSAIMATYWQLSKKSWFILENEASESCFRPSLDHLKCVENNEKTCRWGALLQIYSYRKLHNGDNSWEKKSSGDVWKCIHTSPDFYVSGFYSWSRFMASAIALLIKAVALSPIFSAWSLMMVRFFGGDMNLDFNETIIIFFVRSSTSFG